MRLSPRWAIGLLLVTALAALMPIAAFAAPSAQGGKPYGGKVLQSFVNCGITQVFGVVVDESGNALPGVGVRLWWGGGEVHTTAGTYVRPETNAAGWDFTLNTVNVENTWYVAVEDVASNTLLSDPVAVQTTGHCDAANSANAVKVELRRGAAGSTPAPAPQQPSNPVPAPQQPSGTASGDQAPALTSGATCQTISQTGYQVCDDANARFLAAYQRYGAQNIGYPISTRYSRDGFITQAFQKAILQWRPESNNAAFANVFDDLSRAGMDQRLYETRQTPFQLPSGWEGVNVPFAEAVRLRQGLLSNRPAMRTTYFAASDPLTFFGLPTSEVTDMGNHYAIRLQRAVLQEWKENVPWARAGQVTIANGGDIAKELGLIPGFALTNTTNAVAMSAPASNAPTTFAAPVPAAAPAPAAPVPAAPAPAAPVPAASEPGRNIDPVFSQLGGGIVPANVAPGQAYWRVVSIEWHDEAESGGRHAIQFNTVDQGGSRVAGTPITISWGGGSSTITMEAKPGEPFGANFPMYVDGPSYSARVDGLPSDVVTGMGLGTPETPYLTIHTEYYITWQRVVKQ